MVFNAFRVGLGNLLGHPEASKERYDNLMPSPGFLRELGAFLGEEN